jgi:hypothetical protein
MNRSKDDLRYWQEHGLFKETTTYKNVRKELPDWHVKIRHEGRRERFPLKTPNRLEAAQKARSIYRHSVSSVTSYPSTLVVTCSLY